MYGKIGVPFCTLLIILFRMAQYLFIPQILPLTPSILDYLELLLRFVSYWFGKGMRVGKYMPCVPGTATFWQLPASDVQNCHLVLNFAILSNDVDHLVDYALAGSMEISRNHRYIGYLQKCWRTSKVTL